MIGPRLNVRLLGAGVDAIVMPTRLPRRWFERLLGQRGIDDCRLPPCPTPQEQLARYFDAVALFAQKDQFLARELRGEKLKHQWLVSGFRRRYGTTVVPLQRARRHRKAGRA